MLVFSLTPFAFEMGEWAMHYLVHGDFAHASGHRQSAPQDEHGCTPLLHVCQCHTGFCTPTAERRAEQIAQPVTNIPASLVERVGRMQDPPPHRPPLA